MINGLTTVLSLQMESYTLKASLYIDMIPWFLSVFTVKKGAYYNQDARFSYLFAFTIILFKSIKEIWWENGKSFISSVDLIPNAMGE